MTQFSEDSKSRFPDSKTDKTKEAGRRPDKEPIAIIGIGCRYPGGINSPQTFWNLLRNEVDAITEIPPNRINLDEYYDPEPATPGKMMTREGGFLEKMDLFDAHFFGISPREANYMDPQQRLLLEVAWEALNDGGQVPDRLTGSKTGVYIGMWTNDYEDRMYAASDDIDLYVTTGGGRYSASGRLSYTFDFRGPSMTIDTACSSSLVAVHLACNSLWRGETSLALAGGVNLILEPQITIGYSRSKMLSPDARCKFGDISANGYVRSEGVGMVVLKPLPQALADNDPIYAVVRGSAINNDGRSSGLLVAPGGETQATMMREVYRQAGISPGEVGYIEAHGTGTKVGDPVELQAIGSVVAENRPTDKPCIVGSVKTNIGHTEAASGVAGLIKTALILKYQQIPGNLHFNEPNPNIPWAKLPLIIQKQLGAWPDNMRPAYAGVNSFGVTGTNAHIVLAEAPVPSINRSADLAPAYLLPLSAHSPEALADVAQSYRTMLTNPESPALVDICYTASCRRTHHTERLAVVGESAEVLADQVAFYLQDPVQANTTPNRLDKETKVVFVCPGQGSQWLGMGRELLTRESAFRKVMEECDEAIKRVAGWSLLDQLALDEDAAEYRLNEISVIQPTLFAVEVALAVVWQAWGIEPDAVIGHSMGEVAAAYIAGALNLEDSVRVICQRSQLMQRTSGQGAMAVVGLPYDQAEAALQGYEDKLSIAVHNSPQSTVLSGDPAALDMLMAKLADQDIFCRRIKVDVASHSPQMDPLRPELVEALQNIQPQAGRIPIYSTATKSVSNGNSFNAEYWGENLRQPVQFTSMVQQLLSDDYAIFIELSPHPILLTAIQEIAANADKPAHGILSLRRNQPEQVTMLNALGQLYTLGYPVNWQKLYPADGQIVSLPTYPWQRETFWFESSNSLSQKIRPGAHPLLGYYMRSAVGSHIWETTVNSKLYPYLKDHQVRGAVVFPAAAYVEMVLAAASELYGSNSPLIRIMSFKEALFLSDDDSRILQLIFTADMPDVITFQFYSRSGQNDDQETWTLHAEGKLQPGQEASSPAAVDLAGLTSGSEETPGDTFYQAVATRKLEYGPNFQGITQLFIHQDSVSGKFHLPQELVTGSKSYQFHPVLIDACFQLLLAALPESNLDPYVPVTLEKLQVYEWPNLNDQLWGSVIVKSDPETPAGDILLLDETGRIIMAAHNLRFQRLKPTSQEILNKLFYKIRWQPSSLPETNNQEATGQNHWLIFADNKGAGEALSKQLEKSGQTCTFISVENDYLLIKPNVYQLNPTQPEHFHHLLTDVLQSSSGQSIGGVIHLWSLDDEDKQLITPTSLETSQQRGSLSVLHLVQALAQTELFGSPHLWLVTRGAQAVGTDSEPVIVSQSALWGLGNVIANEFPKLHCTCLDLSLTPMPGEIKLLAQAIQSPDNETQIAFRANQRYVARLTQHAPTVDDASKSVAQQQTAGKHPFKVEVTTPGILDNLALRPMLRQTPKPGQVEIAVKVTGLNFMNIMSALGIYPGYTDGVGPLGIECSGVVSAVGADVSDFKIGDEVVAVAFDSLGTHTVTDAHLVVLKPANLSFEEAATLPIVYLTAYYALYHLGRLQAGERVLIHSATGGVGLAAIQLAQRIGAEIFATAGNPEKRDYLQTMGIQHVMDSRTLDFADQIIEQTNGEGVDVVLNSLTGSAITRNFEILKPYGRFLEIGKRDIYGNSKLDLLPFQNNLAYFAIDLDKMSRQRPEIVGAMLREIFQLVEANEIKPLPLKVFPVSNVSDAFRYMAQAKHIGKIVVSMEDTTTKLDVSAGALPIQLDGTYLITGGLGDLGLTFAGWLAQQGARNLALMGRSKPSTAAQATINELKARGVNIITLQADVTDAAQIAEALKQIEQTLPPLRGIIHAAGLLADSTIPQMDQELFRKAMDPKVLGAWNLHSLTLDKPLDFFILFSSVSAFLGLPGQANYAAANAFLDALAHHRHAQKLPALSINWGPWRDIGLAATQANRGERLMAQGLGSITPEEGLAAMAYLLAQKDPQIGVMLFEAQKWCETYPAAANSSLLADLLRQTADEAQEIKAPKRNIQEALLAATLGRQRLQLFETHLREHVAQVLRLELRQVPLDKPLITLGLDSLMTLELRNRLETSLGVSLPATLIWNYPTITALIPFLAEKILIPLEATAVITDNRQFQTEKKDEVPRTTQAELEDLSKDEVERLLSEELAAIDNLLGESQND